MRQEFRHEFEDPEYFKARSEVTDKAYEALEQGSITLILTFVVRFLSTSPHVSTGIQASSSASVEPVTKKRKATDEGPTMKKTALW